MSARANDASRGEAGGGEPVLAVRGLATSFPSARGRVRVVDGVDLVLRRGRTLGLLGESGSGKSVTALSILRLVPPPGVIEAGEIVLEGRDLARVSEREMRAVRGAEIGWISQEPLAALDPVFPVGEQIAEVLRAHRSLASREARDTAVAMLARVGIPEPERRARAYPHELSGGMRQRVLFAIATACEPRVLLADEPTTALDPGVQAQVLGLLRDLQAERATSVLFISHDVRVVAAMAHEIAVLYAGRVVERGPAAEVLARPAHPYTAALLRARPALDGPRARLEPIPGAAPAPGEHAGACAFHPRCALASDRCRGEAPPLRALDPHAARAVACHHALEPAAS